MTDLERALAEVDKIRGLSLEDMEAINVALAAACREGAAKERAAMMEPYVLAQNHQYEAGRQLEREKVALWMIERSIPTGHGDTVEDLLAELHAGVAGDMRERAEEAIVNLRPVENMQEAAIAAIRALPLTPEEPT